MSKTQKWLYVGLGLVLSAVFVLAGPFMKGPVGTVGIVALGAVLGLVTFFISSGWTYRLELSDGILRTYDRGQKQEMPLDKLGIVVRNGGFPFPRIWLVLKGAGVGTEIPEKGVDARALEQIHAYQKRNPGKKLTFVAVPGGYLRSINGFVGELRRLIPPLTVDERLLK